MGAVAREIDRSLCSLFDDVCVSERRGKERRNSRTRSPVELVCPSDRLSRTMLTILAAGSVFFPGLFLLSKQCLRSIPALRWSEGDAVIVSARLDLLKLVNTEMTTLFLQTLPYFSGASTTVPSKFFHQDISSCEVYLYYSSMAGGRSCTYVIFQDLS